MLKVALCLHSQHLHNKLYSGHNMVLRSTRHNLSQLPTTCSERWSHSYSHNMSWLLTTCCGRPSTWATFTTDLQHVVEVSWTCCGPVVSRPKHPCCKPFVRSVVIDMSTLLVVVGAHNKLWRLMWLNCCEPVVSVHSVDHTMRQTPVARNYRLVAVPTLATLNVGDTYPDI